MCCIKIFRCGISSSLCHVLHRCLSALAPDDFAPDCEPSIVPDIFPVERPIVTPHAVPPPDRPLDEVPARARSPGARARSNPRPSPRALWRCRAPEPRRASDEFHRTPRGASHTAGDVARTGATRERARIPTPMAPMARDAARGDRMR